GAEDGDRRYEARRTLLKLHADAAEWFHENLLKRDVGEPARKYLKHRGIMAETAKHWQLGYAPDEWDAFGAWARARGYHNRDLITSGLAKTRDDAERAPGERSSAYDRFRGRIIFPICNEVVLCFDADAAGQKAAERSLDALLQNDLIVRIAEMPAGEDPDSLVQHEGKQAFESRVARARDFFDYWIERETTGVDLGSLGAKMQLARSLAETVSRIRDPLMRGEVVSKVSARLGVAAQDF